MTMKLRILIISILSMLAMPASVEAYPEFLDDAELGPVSKENPFFSEVLIHPITEGRWSKLAETIYEGPSEMIYSYDSTTGLIDAMDGVTRVGDRIYGEDGRLISRTIHDYDDDGNLIRTRVYGNYVFNDDGTLRSFTRTDYDADGDILNSYDYEYEDGQLVALTRTRFDSEGNSSAIYEYTDYEYGVDGRAVAYTRTDKNPAGDVLRSYGYSDITRYLDGRTQSYTRNDYGGDGELVRMNGYTFNTEGRVTGLARTNYVDGDITGSNTYSNYDYNADNRTTQYDRVDRDADGNTVRSYDYRDYDYHDNGKTSSYERTDRDEVGQIVAQNSYAYSDDGRLNENTRVVYSGGVVDRSYRYSEYTYNSNNRHTSFRLEYMDSVGALTQTLLRSGETYNSSNRLTSYSNQFYNSDASFKSWYDYSNRSYDSGGQVESYDWVRRDEAGNVIDSGSWSS
jgi:hypothetical protein